jgi:SAM-dependent methyltransferase
VRLQPLGHLSGRKSASFDPRKPLREAFLSLPYGATTPCNRLPIPLSHSRCYSAVLPQPRILDVGCGIHKQPGSIGIDRNPASRADVLVDLDRFPYPFADSSFDRLTAIHVIEHVNDVIRTMEEFHRLVRPGGTVRIETPHYTDFSSFCDPTHKSHLNSFSFRYFGENHGGFGYYSAVKFREISVRVKLLALWRWLGFEFLVNHFPRYRRFWEHYLCYVVRGKVMEFEFQALK